MGYPSVRVDKATKKRGAGVGPHLPARLRRHAREALEDAREVALVGEAGVERDVGQLPTLHLQLPARELYPLRVEVNPPTVWPRNFLTGRV